MTSKAKNTAVNVALFGSAAALCAWGLSKAKKEGPQTNTTAAYATFGGIGLGLIGAFRINTKLGIGVGVGLLAVGQYNRYRREHGMPELPLPGVAISWKNRTLDVDTAAAFAFAMQKETDPAVLHAFAARLSAAGYKEEADAIAKKATAALPPTPMSTVVGHSSQVIKAAQSMLRDLGYNVEQSGVLDAITVKAIKEFQSLHDIDIDGALNTETLAALRSATKEA